MTRTAYHRKYKDAWIKGMWNRSRLPKSPSNKVELMSVEIFRSSGLFTKALQANDEERSQPARMGSSNSESIISVLNKTMLEWLECLQFRQEQC